MNNRSGEVATGRAPPFIHHLYLYLYHLHEAPEPNVLCRECESLPLARVPPVPLLLPVPVPVPPVPRHRLSVRERRTCL
eukprot:4144566-Pyramimonas_sp.AAC.1